MSWFLYKCLRMKHLTTILVLFSSIQAAAAEVVTFDHNFYLRSEPVFTRAAKANILGVAATGQKGIVVDRIQTRKGNTALKVVMQDGSRAGKAHWVYMDKSNPRMRMSDDSSVTTEVALDSVRPKTRPEKAVEAKIPCVNCSTASPVQEISGALSDQYSPAFAGALKTMAVMYQSCEAIEKPYIKKGRGRLEDFLSGGKERRIAPQNLSRVAANHYYLQNTKAQASSCIDMRQAPPLYTYGGSPSIKGNTIDLFINQSKGGVARPGIDCSHFVSTALRAAGLKITQSSSLKHNYTTSAGYFNLRESNSCFIRPSFNSNETIKSGDIVAWDGHVVMIDKVGKDPFGIDAIQKKGFKISSQNSCDKLPISIVDHFNFGVIESSGTPSVAIMRSGVSSKKKYYHLAMQACKAKFGTLKTSRSSSANLIRHSGSDACKLPQKPQFKGEQCVASCV